MFGSTIESSFGEGLSDERGLVGWVLVLIILGAIFVIYLLIQLLQAIF